MGLFSVAKIRNPYPHCQGFWQIFSFSFICFPKNIDALCARFSGVMFLVRTGGASHIERAWASFLEGSFNTAIPWRQHDGCFSALPGMTVFRPEWRVLWSLLLIVKCLGCGCLQNWAIACCVRCIVARIPVPVPSVCKIFYRTFAVPVISVFWVLDFNN